MSFKIAPNLKAWVAALGGVATAVTTFLAAVSLAVGNDEISAEEVSSVTSAAVALIATVYGVWKAENKE